MNQENFEVGDKILCIASGNAFDNGNRVFKGEYYTVDALVNNNIEKINGEACEDGVLVHRFSEDKRDIYPYVWNKNRFRLVKEVIDNSMKNVRVCADEYTW